MLLCPAKQAPITMPACTPLMQQYCVCVVFAGLLSWQQLCSRGRTGLRPVCADRTACKLTIACLCSCASLASLFFSKHQGPPKTEIMAAWHKLTGIHMTPEADLLTVHCMRKCAQIMPAQLSIESHQLPPECCTLEACPSQQHTYYTVSMPQFNTRRTLIV